MVEFRAYGGHGADGDSTAEQTRRAAGRRGSDRPAGRAAVRACPSEGDGLGHLLTAPLPFAALRAGSSGEGEPVTNCHSRVLGDTILPSMRDIRVATVQFQHAAGDKAYNFGRIRHFVTEAARARVELIAFPEMCLTGYWHMRKLSRTAFEALAEPVPDGPSMRDLLDLSRQHGLTIGAGLLERAPDGGRYNAYVVAMPGRAWALHR